MAVAYGLWWSSLRQSDFARFRRGSFRLGKAVEAPLPSPRNIQEECACVAKAAQAGADEGLDFREANKEGHVALPPLEDQIVEAVLARTHLLLLLL